MSTHGCRPDLIFVTAGFRAALAVLLCSGSLCAQELTGTLYGLITASDGARLPGVTVTVTSSQLIRGSETRVTNADGTYRLAGLPPGTYGVKAELSGFQTMSRDNIAMAAGAALSVDFKLTLAGMSESVTVVGLTPLVDVKNSQTTRIIDASLLDNIPTARNFADAIITAPGVLDSQYGFAPAESVLGSSVRDNVFNVDGAVANDSTVGYMSTQIPFDIIDQVQVTTGGISAEFGQASGAVFNFITKSGGNDLHGGASVFLKNDSLTASNLSQQLLDQGLTRGTKDIKNLERGFTVGGPIAKNRIWFFGNVRWLNVEQSNPDFPAANPTNDQRQGFGKISSQLTKTTSLQGSFTQQTLENFPSNATFATNNNAETWQRGVQDQRIGTISLTQTLNENTFFDVQLGQTRVRLDTEPALDAVGSQDITTGRFFGGWTGTLGKTFKRDKRGIKANISRFQNDFLGGSHNFKAGYYNEFSPFARIRAIYGDTFQLFQTGAPYRVDLYNTPRTPQTNVSLWDAYVQDAWTLKRVTLNLGVRFESTEGWQPAQDSGGGRWFPVEHFPEQRGQVKWFSTAPRLGVVWDVQGDKRTSVRASFGRYYEALLNQHVLAANRGQAGLLEYDWIDRNGNRTFEDGEQGTLRRNTIANANFFDPDLRQPYVDTIQVGIDRQIGSKLAFSVTGIYKRERDILQTVNVGVPFSAYFPITVTNPINQTPLTIYALSTAYQGVQSVMKLTNPTNPVALYRDYYGVELVGRRRMADNWQFQASLDLGRSTGNIGNSFGDTSGLSSLYGNPNTLINATGPLNLDAPVQLKLQGTYVAPYKIAISTIYSGLSGFPIHPTGDFPTDTMGAYTVRFTSAQYPQLAVQGFVDVAGEPRGTHRFDFRNELSVRVEKQVELGRTQVGLLADVFNVLNINTLTAVQIMRFGTANFLKPAIIVAPRAVRLGARFTF
jgi:Carboxypeptidase regulatory-like domain